MAKIGLNYGEKLQIADKTYRVITDGLDVPAVLGKLTFRGIEGPDIIFDKLIDTVIRIVVLVILFRLHGFYIKRCIRGKLKQAFHF